VEHDVGLGIRPHATASAASAAQRISCALLVTELTAFTQARSEDPDMAHVIPFPRRAGPLVPREPTLREILLSRGIEPTGEERKRKRREASTRRKTEKEQGGRG